MSQHRHEFGGEINAIIRTTTSRAFRLVAVAGIANALVMLSITIFTRTEASSLILCLAWVGAWTWFFMRAPHLVRPLTLSPWIIPVVALTGKLLIIFDGGFEGMASTQMVWLTLIAAIAGTWRTVLATFAALAFGEIAAVLAVNLTPAELLDHPDRARMASEIFGALILSLSGIVVVRTFRANLMSTPDHIAGLRVGTSGPVPALAAAIGHAAPHLPPGPVSEEIPATASGGPSEPTSPLDLLTPAEVDVVAHLADGLAPKQVAVERGTSIGTVRTQIKSAKRKTGAKTINELVAMKWRSP